MTLWWRWRSQFPGPRALWLSVFHSISAFCNAGFSLFPDSLVGYRADVLVNLAVSALIIVGGLGFLVNMELRDQLMQRLRRRRAGPLSLHSKLVLSVSGILLAVGMLGFLALEWDNLLRGLPLDVKLLASWFQAVTPRTAGFNTVDYARAAPDTLFFTACLMFVGASPGSTGGGIKTTSLGLLLGLVVARWRGRGRATLFRRTIPHAAMDRALSVVLLSWGLVSIGLMVLLVLLHRDAPHTLGQPSFIALMFEAVSAFGTVGLSTGITGSLPGPAKVVLIVLMYVGRVGPLTLALAVGPRKERGRFRYAEENVMVG